MKLFPSGQQLGEAIYLLEPLIEEDSCEVCRDRAERALLELRARYFLALGNPEAAFSLTREQLEDDLKLGQR
jgi:hypothetical protein